MSRISAPVQVEVFTSSHRIFGRLQPGPLGLLAYMARATESVLEIEEGQSFALHQTAEQAEQSPSVSVVKSEIVAVAVGSRGDIGSAGIPRGGYTKPFPHRVRILVAGYELRGLVESAGKLDFRALLIEGENLFEPMYDAELQAVLFPRIQLRSPALLFNRKRVQAVSSLPRGG